MAIYYILTAFSVLLETVKNVLSNVYSKENIKCERDIYQFNVLMYGAAMGVMLILQIINPSPLSAETAMLSAMFAFAIGGMQTTFLRALRCGPLSYVNFIQTSGLVIPALFGAVCYGQAIAIRQIIALPLLLFSMALVMDLKKEKASGKWIGDAVASMFCLGFVGIIQSIHQASNYADEQNSFLALSFFFVVLINIVSYHFTSKELPKKKRFSLQSSSLSLLSGVVFGVVNVLNLFLIGVMPSIVFFPIANGGLLIATLLAAVWIFRESLNTKQWVGVVIGIISMCMIGV